MKTFCKSKILLGFLCCFLIGSISISAKEKSVIDLPQEQIVDKIPLKRLGEPEDIAKTVKFLALDTTYITGQVIGVDGGLVI